MALSFGSLAPSTASLPFSTGTIEKPVYQDRIMRLASAGQPVAKAATNVPLSFGTAVPKYDDAFASGQNLSFPASVPKSNPISSLFGSAGDFLKLASFGSSTGGSYDDGVMRAARQVPQSPAVYDDGVMRAARQVTAIPRVHTATIDGGTSTLTALKDAARGLMASIGSSGDGEIVQVSGGGDGGGFNPLYILGAAALVGGLYYASKK